MVSAEADMSSRYQAPYSPNPRMGGSHHAYVSSCTRPVVVAVLTKAPQTIIIYFIFRLDAK